MTRQERKERERAQRRQVIVNAARELAEAEGWESVTTRRLADCIEYSQPVLYSHFENKDAIVRAVAIEGFADMAVQLRSARQGASSRDAAVRALAQAYLDFAATHPALYEAMFSLPIDVRFGTPGQTRFWFMWDELIRGAVGAAVLVDTRRIADAFAPLDYFENRHLPYLVALNCFDGAPRYEPEEVREALAIASHVPLIMCDARHRDSVKTVLIGVVEHAMATLVAEQGGLAAPVG